MCNSYRKRILAFAGHYLPGYRGGGPIRTLANMVSALSDDFEFLVFTADRDSGDLRPYGNVRVNEWNKVGHASVFYAGPSMQSLRGVYRVLGETKYDVLYLNSYFSPVFSIAPLVLRRSGLAPAKPVILAPRGEFSPGAYKLKWWKKAPFVRVAEVSGLHRSILWHASTELESADILRIAGRTARDIGIAENIVIAPDMVSSALVENETPKKAEHDIDGGLRVCFLSRVSRKKNLTFALEVLSQIRDLPIQFDIYGPLEDEGYWAECRSVILRLPPNIKVSYRGDVEHARVQCTIRNYALFFVPTLGENFGHVFYEAFSAGVPVLTSDQTPWRGLAGRGVGWDAPLADPMQFVSAIRTAFAWTEAERGRNRSACVAFATEGARSDSALAMNRALFERSLTAGGAPSAA